MKKKKEIEKECMYNCEENCECGHQEGKECSGKDDCCQCKDNCHCDECCSDNELNVVEEHYVLIGEKNDKKTKDAMKILDKNNARYEFMDLDNVPDEFKETAKDMASKLEVPSLMVFQLIESGIVPGLEDIKNYFK